MLPVGPASRVPGWKPGPRAGQFAPTASLWPHLALGKQRGDGPEGELQHHQGGHPGPHDGQDQGQPNQVHGLQGGPRGLQPLLFQPPLWVAVGAEWA